MMIKHDNANSEEMKSDEEIKPTQSSAENPPKSNLQNLTHSGVCAGGVNEFGPFFSSSSLARVVVRPSSRFVSYRITSSSMLA